MDRSDLGFAFFLTLLLLAPGVPVPGFAASSSVSLAAAGLVVWFMLAPRLPLRAVLTMPTILGLIGFAIYALLVSLASGRLVSIAYGAQYAFYAILGGLLIPGYLVHKIRHGREAEAWRILAWVGGIYVAGIIVSYWTGPIWTFQGPGGKQYGDLLVVRARGFSESVNAAAGIAALVTVFFLLLHPPSRLHSALLAAGSFTALVLTLSRSAIVAFMAAILLLGVLLAFRALFLRGKVASLRVRLVPIGLVFLVFVASLASYHHPMGVAAWQRLALDDEYRSHDVDARLHHWESGLERWAADLPPLQQIVGAGFHSSGLWSSTGAIATAHNFYIQVLNDFGLVGLLLFLAILAASIIKAMQTNLLLPKMPMARFCFCGITVLIIHNLTQIFFYDIATLMWLTLLLTCNELAGRRAAAVTSDAKASGRAWLPGVPVRSRATWHG